MNNTQPQKYFSDSIPHITTPPRLPSGALRIYALGGIGHIGRNMTVFEFAGKLLIIDCGVLFPGPHQPGVDLILPDFGPIIPRLDDVVAVVVTHGHEDHIGAIPFLLRLRPDIPIVASLFTLALIRAKCEEHYLRPITKRVKENDTIALEPFSCEFVAVSHSIPDALGIVLTAGENTIIHTGDIKLDQTPPDGRITDISGFARCGSRGVDLLLIDSTNAEVGGVSGSERDVGKALYELIAQARQKVVVTCFASNISRIQHIINAAVRTHRKVAFVGRSMVRNVGIAEELGFITIPVGIVADLEQIQNLPDDQIILITTGSQGENLAGLARIARGDHRSVKVRAGDTIVFASSLIPGNEHAVFGIINEFVRMGVVVITNNQAKIHVSGHGYSGELLQLYNAIRPRCAMPVHGEWRHLVANANLALSTGIPEDRIVLAETGVVVDLARGKANIVGRLPVGEVFVDGLIVGDVDDDSISDRLVLGNAGFINITVAVNSETGKYMSAPVIFGRGFSDDPKALDDLVPKIEKQLTQLENGHVTDTHRIAQVIRRTAGKWVADKYRRKPMIAPTVVMVR